MKGKLEFQKEQDKVIDDQLADILEDAELDELFNEAANHGEVYFQGYKDGFWRGWDILLKDFGTRIKKIDDSLRKSLGKL